MEGSGKGPMGGRRFIKEYMEQGWISEDDITNPKLETVAKAAKVSDEIRPELVVNISINKMCINGLASKMLNIETGDYMKAMVLTADQCENDVNKKFFIMVSKVKTDDMMTLAAVGKAKGVGRKLFCSYAACYSQFLQNTPDAQAITADKLAELGYAYGIDKKDSEGKPYTKYTANREVHYELVDTGIDYPNSDGSMLRIWACVNAQIIDRPYDPSVEAETAVPGGADLHCQKESQSGRHRLLDCQAVLPGVGRHIARADAQRDTPRRAPRAHEILVHVGLLPAQLMVVVRRAHAVAVFV